MAEHLCKMEEEKGWRLEEMEIDINDLKKSLIRLKNPKFSPFVIGYDIDHLLHWINERNFTPMFQYETSV